MDFKRNLEVLLAEKNRRTKWERREFQIRQKASLQSLSEKGKKERLRGLEIKLKDRRGGRVAYYSGLLNRQSKDSQVRILPSPPQ